MPRAPAVVVLLVLAGLLAGCAGLGGDDVSVIRRADRTPAPPLRVDTLDGAGELALSDYAGRPVVLNFWASWCEPCQREMPALVDFAAANPDWQVVGVAVTDVPSESRAFAREYGIGFPLGSDQSGAASRPFALEGLPVTVFIDAAGRVAGRVIGEITPGELDGYADEIGTSAA